MPKAKLAAALFPNPLPAPEDLETRYPSRNLPEGARVTRFAPSPTGFLHIGSLYTAFVNQLTVRATGGVFFLRIEDTDKKREVEGGVQSLLESLAAFGIVPDEGTVRTDVSHTEEQGAYGPYTQSARRDIYQAFAKALVLQGLAYPCFCTEDELSTLRDEQGQAGAIQKGYWGKWARCRDLPVDEAIQHVQSGEPWVLRLRSNGNAEKRVPFTDEVRGKIEMPENILDAVILKTDGVPTYHFAHAVDDHLMRTTHVIRSEEWLASVPLHLELFRACGFKPPKYAHISAMMKSEDGGKRKLSKRKDPEAAVSWFARQGYPADAVLEYLMCLISSQFEDWRKANPAVPRESFPFTLKKMSASGALFDLVKLTDVSKGVIAAMSGTVLAGQATVWAREFDPQLADILAAHDGYLAQILAIDRDGAKKPRKDISRYGEVREYVSYFFDELFKSELPLPDEMTQENAAAILDAYEYSAGDDKDAWFARIRELAVRLGFAASPKEYKENPGAFKGHVGDVSAVIRAAVTGRPNTPDLWAICRVFGEERVRGRLRNAIDRIKK
ncbi:MAG: glutamate--tRNA ligase [Oscillospiraceae bacterium]|jgi:glutamyl-tRNA synthetase|nr:glutamate--tRNA ligase [Oscillospiraceae bacterium]